MCACVVPNTSNSHSFSRISIRSPDHVCVCEHKWVLLRYLVYIRVASGHRAAHTHTHTHMRDDFEFSHSPSWMHYVGACWGRAIVMCRDTNDTDDDDDRPSILGARIHARPHTPHNLLFSNVCPSMRFEHVILMHNCTYASASLVHSPQCTSPFSMSHHVWMRVCVCASFICRSPPLFFFSSVLTCLFWVQRDNGECVRCGVCVCVCLSNCIYNVYAKKVNKQRPGHLTC